MLNGRTYVVTDPALAVAVQRASHTLDFDDLVAEFTPRLVGLNKGTANILRDPTAKEEGRTRLVTKSHSVINTPLMAHNISAISQKQLDHFCDYINNIKDGDETGLFKAVRTEIVAAAMHTFYGPQNPFAMHPELVDKYWDWDDGCIGYAVNVFPKITARKAYYGMEACVKGFIEYNEKGRYKQAQPFLQDRLEMHYAEGISVEEHARLEVAISFGFNSNASVTSFWVIQNIFRDPALLEQVREEIYTNAFEAPGTISSTKLRESCPLMNSIWRETLRSIAPMSSSRSVLQDTNLLDTYLLRKGSVVQIAGIALHADNDIWGPDVASFNPRRFVHNSNGTKTTTDGTAADSKANAVHPAAFRSFGGGASLCPGRHFAHMEVTALAAVIAMGFDLQPVKGSERVDWNPPKDEKRFLLVGMKPLRDVNVSFVRRKGWEDVKWVMKA
jgi:cytochrome P450